MSQGGDLHQEVYDCKECAFGPRSERKGLTVEEEARSWTITPPGHVTTIAWPGGEQKFTRSYEIIACERHDRALQAWLDEVDE